MVSEEYKQSKEQKIIKKFVEESKVIKLIDRLCWGDFLSYNQCIQIFEFVEKKGKKCIAYDKIVRCTGIHYNQIEESTKEIVGKHFLGIFVYEEYGYKYIRFVNPKLKAIKTLRIYDMYKEIFWI